MFISMVRLVDPRSFRSLLKEQPTSMFRDEQIVFSSNYNITRILVPVDGKYIQSNDKPSIFFTISDPKSDSGSCIYVLEGLAAYEVLEGGRDSTADFGVDKTVYFGAKDGIYQYDPETLSAKRYGSITDDILQIQKLNGTEAFYILTSDKIIYKIDNQGENKTRVTSITCATEFVLDVSNNIYYVSCIDNLPHIVLDNGTEISCVHKVEKFSNLKLLRPAFVMEDYIPFFGDGFLYIMHVNGTSVKKYFSLKETPTAFSVEAAVYIVVAINGKIYEFNVMEVLVKSMFGLINEWPRDLNKMVLSMMDNVKGNCLATSCERLM